MLHLLLVRQRTHRGALAKRRHGLSHTETESVRGLMHFVVSVALGVSWVGVGVFGGLVANLRGPRSYTAGTPTRTRNGEGQRL